MGHRTHPNIYFLGKKALGHALLNSVEDTRFSELGQLVSKPVIVFRNKGRRKFEATPDRHTPVRKKPVLDAAQSINQILISSYRNYGTSNPLLYASFIMSHGFIPRARMSIRGIAVLAWAAASLLFSGCNSKPGSLTVGKPAERAAAHGGRMYSVSSDEPLD